MRRDSKPAGIPETVCYRLPDNYQEELCRRAKAEGISHGEYARQVLVDHLEDSARREMRRQLSALMTEIALLRGDLATVSEALLVITSHGAAVTPTESRAWVEERLRQAGKGR